MNSLMQEPFNEIAVEYTERLTAGLQIALREKCIFKSPKTKLLLEEIFDFITFRLNKTVAGTIDGGTDPDMR